MISPAVRRFLFAKAVARLFASERALLSEPPSACPAASEVPGADRGGFAGLRTVFPRGSVKPGT